MSMSRVTQMAVIADNTEALLETAREHLKTPGASEVFESRLAEMKRALDSDQWFAVNDCLKSLERTIRLISDVVVREDAVLDIELICRAVGALEQEAEKA